MALPEPQLSVHYQPQVQLSTGALVGFEASDHEPITRWIIAHALASLAATCRQSGSSFADFLVPRLALGPGP